VPNLWNLLYFKVFDKQIDELTNEVTHLREIDPENYKNHPKTKLLAKVVHNIQNRVLVNPLDPQFNLGKTLGKTFTYYKRIKEGLPDRYRAFFRFQSSGKIVVMVWMNNEFSLLKAGSKTDVYNVFLKMLVRGEVPSNWKGLIEDSKPK
jgi:toxin YhaV